MNGEPLYEEIYIERLLDELKKQKEFLEKGLFPITEQGIRQLAGILEEAHNVIVDFSWQNENLRNGGPL